MIVKIVSATLFRLSLAFIFQLKLFRDQFYSVPKYIINKIYKSNILL